MNFNFDGVNKIITPIDAPVSGIITVDVQDIYSRWVDWFLSSDNSSAENFIDVVVGFFSFII